MFARGDGAELGDARLERIAVYNCDDVRATHALHQWLVEQRGDDLPWRPAFVEQPESPFAEINAQVVALHEFDPDTLEHLLGDVLGYWRREGRVEMAHLLAKLGSDAPDQLRDQDMLSGLRSTGEAQRSGKKDKELKPGLGFAYPDQPVAMKYAAGKASVMYSTGDGPPGYASVESLDTSSRSFTMTLSRKYLDLGVIPSSVVLKDTFNDKPKLESLSVLASEVLDAATASNVPRVGLALLRNVPPIFADGHGPTDTTFSDDLASILGWAPHLQHSVVAIRGPPGTGKTYTGAHIALELARQGKRVGITAMSHSAINNLLREVIKVFSEAGEPGRLQAIRKGPDKVVSGLDLVAFTTANPPCANVAYNVVAGTSWLFAGNDMRDSPVDVLLTDEAGQLALADALAASMSTNSLLLLGDPAQLAQVSQAIHPGGAGASVLEHVLGDAVIPDDRGVFLAATRRMHPDVCRFISEQIYEGRLVSHETCAAQTTDFGTGLRWLRAQHKGCSMSSTEEAMLVRDAIAEQIGHSWTDNGGTSHRLTAADHMVVAPYNDQVAELRKALDSDERTRGVRAGTVDKFQGQEAPVVFFTMTTSADVDMPRGADFLFSRNRLNVAISRARCLAYLVCTDELLNTRARDVREMKLISTLCAFVEQATPI
jgi:hypothetical protein